MNVSVSIDFSQLKSIVEQCNIDEKIELLHVLEQQTFSQRFKQLLHDLKTDDLSLEEITTEVEMFRQQQFDLK